MSLHDRGLRLQGDARSRLRTTLLLIALAAALILLSVLQYRWTGEISRAERERSERALASASERLAGELERDLLRAVFAFQPERRRRFGAPPPAPRLPLAERIRRGVERWHELSPQPDLIADVLAVRRSGRDLELLRWSEPDRLEAIPWPEQLRSLRPRLGLGRPGPVLDPQALLVALPQDAPSPPTRAPLRGVPEAWIVLQLDQSHLRDSLLPALVEDHFGASADSDFDLAILRPAGSEPIYRSRDDLETPLESPDLERFLLAPGPRRGEAEGVVGLDADEATLRGLLLLQVRHRQGSLAAAVAQNRRRNLAISLGVLALLAWTVFLVVRSSRRAERLARQQLEFVSGLTHELHTPLAAIRSAGQNLADGVVRGDDKVERYGDLLVRESQRLSTLVEQALELAGIQSGRQRSLRPVDLSELVASSLRDVEWLSEEYGVAVAADLPDHPCTIDADASALSRVLHNLLTNAVKYSSLSPGAEPVELRVLDGNDEVRLEVVDHGPGIPPEERRHVFEPFFRGRLAAQGTVPGSGLGLHLARRVVEGHDGDIVLESSERGTRVTVILPKRRDIGGDR